MPLLIWIIIFLYLKFGQLLVDMEIKDAHGATWKSKHTIFTLEVTQLKAGKMKEYLIQVFDGETITYKKNILIDWDMGGGGFIGAMQTDHDPDLEVAVFQKHRPKDNFYIDFENNRIIEKPFNNAMVESQKTAKSWLHYYVPHPFYFMVLIAFTLIYYGLYLMFWLIIRLFSTKSGTNPPSKETSF